MEPKIGMWVQYFRREDGSTTAAVILQVNSPTNVNLKYTGWTRLGVEGDLTKRENIEHSATHDPNTWDYIV